MRIKAWDMACCPITGWKIYSDKPKTFEDLKVKRDYRRKVYKPKKQINGTITAS